MRPAWRLAALALALAAAEQPTTHPAATDAEEELRALRKELAQDELTQQRLLKQKHTADVKARDAEEEAAGLRTELKDTRAKLDSANSRVGSLTREVATEQTLAGDLAAKDGVAEVDAADEEKDDRSETRAAKSMAMLLRRATTAQTSLLAQDQRLQVEALEGMRAKMAASSWREQANVAASALEGSLGSATDIQGALDEVLEREHRAEEARRKEKAFLTSRLKSEMEKLKAAQDEVRALKAQRDHPPAPRTGTQSHDPPTESTTELRADLRAAQKTTASLRARIDSADKKVKTLETDNAKAAGTIRDLKSELHAERKQRKTAEKAPAPATAQHVEYVSAPHKRHARTREQKAEAEDIY
jgi:hypothetical protein